jgi:hypothetical protein
VAPASIASSSSGCGTSGTDTKPAGGFKRSGWWSSGQSFDAAADCTGSAAVVRWLGTNNPVRSAGGSSR